MTTDDLFDFDEDEGPTRINSKEYEAKMKSYNSPSKHVCDQSCTTGVTANYHETHDIFDDFEMSQRQREKMYMEVVQARGRDNKERTLLRMFQGVNDGLYYIRMQTATSLTVERMGEITFESLEDCHDYYNYCIDIFGFDKANKVGQEDEYEDMFSALDDDDDLFDIGDDEDEGLFDIEEDDEGLWD